MRREAQKAKEFTAKKNVKPPKKTVRQILQSVETRLEGLERRVEDLEGWSFGSLESPGLGQRKKPGTRKKIGDTELFYNRDEFVLWLESIWPEAVSAVLGANNPKDLLRVLGRYANPIKYRRPYEARMLRNTDALLEFLRSPNFVRKPLKQTVITALAGDWDEEGWRAATRLPPRRIANAMAGVPEISWRTSLDRCSKTPSKSLPDTRTAEYYRKMYDLPAYYLGENISEKTGDQWEPTVGPFYSSSRARTRADELSAEGKIVCVKSESELEEMAFDTVKLLERVTYLEPGRTSR